MKHVWHLTRYDLLNFWKSATFLALVQVGIVVYPFLHDLMVAPSTRVQFINQVFISIWGVTLISVLGSIFFSYPVFRVNSHWLTRPITPLAILTSRILSAGLLVALPAALVNGCTLLVFGLTGDVVLDNSVALACTLLLMTAPISLLAVQTDKLVRFWLALIAVPLIATLIISQSGFKFYQVAPVLLSTRTALSLITLAIGTLAVLASTYLWRSRLRSLIATVVVIACSSAIGLAWRWPLDFFADRDIPEIQAPANITATVSREPRSSTASFPERSRVAATDHYRGLMKLLLLTPQPTWNAARLEGVIMHPASPEVPSYAAAEIEKHIPITEAIKQSLGTDFICVNADTLTYRPTFLLRKNSLIRDDRGRFVGSVRVEKISHRLTAELPLKPGHVQRFDASRLEMVEADMNGHRCNVALIHYAAQRKFSETTIAERSVSNGTYVLINRRLNQVVSLTVAKGKSQAGALMGHRRQQINLSTYLPVTADVSPAQWLADATLGVIATTPETFFRLPVEFPLNLPASPAPAL